MSSKSNGLPMPFRSPSIHQFDAIMRAIPGKKRKMHRAIVIAWAILTIVAPVAFARTWYIKPDGTGDAPTIQAGVDAANVGDVILVAAGSYTAASTIDVGGIPTAVCVVINKDVSMTSEGGPLVTTIGDASAKIAIYLTNVGSNAEVSGFRIQTSFSGFACVDATSRSALQAPPSPLFSRGIKCENSSPLLRDNNLSVNDVGIELIASPAVVKSNTISFGLVGVGAYNSNAEIAENVINDCATLIVCESSALNAHDNDLHGGCTGIRAWFGSSLTATSNSLHHLDVDGINSSQSSVALDANRFEEIDIGVRMSGAIGLSLIRGNIFVSQQFGAIDLSDNQNAQITIEGNTIVGTGFGSAIFCQAASNPVIRGNIITGTLTGVRCALSSFPMFECNDIVAIQGRYVGDCVDQTGINGNISVDPQFCGLPGSGNFFLQNDSPCAPGNHPGGHDCGLIGALAVGCGPVSTKTVTWGEVKAMYRR